MNIFQKIKELMDYDNTISEKQKILNEIASGIENKKDELSKIQSEIESTNNIAKETVANKDSILAEVEKQRQDIIEKYHNEEIAAKAAFESENAKFLEQKAEAETQTKQSALLSEKIKLYRSLIRKITSAVSQDNDVPLEELLSQSNELVPTIELHLNAFDVKELRNLYKENEKAIDALLSKYEKRYTTKSNKAIYQLMVLALRAELQNILTNLKFTTLDKCTANLDEMISKYMKIASDGNQQIAPTINNFIQEIHTLFLQSIEIEYKYFIKKEQEKAEQQALKEQMRQEAEERRALAEQQKQVEKEEGKYKTEIERVEAQMTSCQDTTLLQQLEAKIAELNAKLKEVEHQKEEITKLQNGKAGYVYVISNLGSFGENTFKIGMTRRLDPMERVKELGDASVPFSFDVHSFIFSDNAVDLEGELHKRLNNQRTNKVNLRKEFFDISVDELEKLVQEVDPSAEFNKTMVATEYRQSLVM